MKLRFRILEPVSTGDPDYDICNQGASVVNRSNVSFVLNVDGTEIIDTVDLGGYTFPTAPIETTHGYNVTVEIEDTDYFVVNIDFAYVWETTPVYIKITKTNYNVFEKTFMVYGYDIGNNGNQTYDNGFPITDNPPFDILLVKTTYGTGLVRILSNFTAIRRPFTDRIYLYNMSSTTGTFSYTNADSDEVLLETEDGFITEDEEIDISQTVTLGEDTCLTTKTVSVKKEIPDFTVSVDPHDANECPIVGDTVNIVTSVDYLQLTPTYIDDVKSYPNASQELKYEIFDYTGNLVFEQSFNYDLDTIPFIFNPEDYDIENYVFPDKGDFIVRVTLGVSSVYACQKSVPVSSKYWYEIDKVDCAIYRVNNYSFNSAVITISKLTDNKTFTEVKQVTVPMLSNVDVDLEEDGVYKFVTTKDNDTYIYVVINTCIIQGIFLDLSNNSLCCNPKDPCNHKDVYNTVAFGVSFMTLMGMLNSEYNVNFLYSYLDTAKLTELYEVNDLITHLLGYGNDLELVDCNCDCK